MSKVIIIGGGIIGLSCAYFLRKNGRDVVVIDKESPGGACSSGNMGWISPTLSEPVPAPGLVKTSLKWMIRRDSPLYIKPTAVPSLSQWLFQFWRHCNLPAFESGFHAGLDINQNTLLLFDELEKEKMLQFESYRKGLLCVFLNDRLIEGRLDELRLVERIGLPAPELKTKQQILEMEPHLIDEVKGGIFLPAERHVRPESLTKGLKYWLLENGVKIIAYSEVKEFVQHRDQIVAVRTMDTVIEGDDFIVTAGAWMGNLLKKVGISLPMTAGKGYSITISETSVQIQQPLYLGDSKVAISPYKNAVRIGGTMELSGINTNLDERRVENLRKSVKRYFKSSIRGREKVWTGMRPMTPDGLPVLGKVPNYQNLYVAGGHAMSGMAMSLSTGVILSDLICTGETNIDLRPFSPDRFNKSHKNSRNQSADSKTLISK